MYTLGFRFKPWTDAKAIADGPSILAYLQETVAEHHLDPSIRYDHRVLRASWSTEEARWTVDLATGPDQTPVTMTTRFCSYAAATTTMTTGTGRTPPVRTTSPARSCIRSIGRRTST